MAKTSASAHALDNFPHFGRFEKVAVTTAQEGHERVDNRIDDELVLHRCLDMRDGLPRRVES